MSLREKSTWSCLLSTVVIYAWYFAKSYGLYEAGKAGGTDMVLLFAAAVIAQIIVLVVAHVIMTIRSGQEAVDERDRAIELRSLRYSHFCLSGGVMMAVLGILFGEVVGEAGESVFAVSPFILGNALLLSFVAAEVLYYGTQVFYYRRGI